MEILQKAFYGNKVLEWLIALGASLIALAVLEILKAVVIRRLAQFSKKTETDWDDFITDLLGQTKFLVLVIVSLWVGSYFLELPEKVARVLRHVSLVALTIQAAFWGNAVIVHWVSRAAEKSATAEERVSVGRSAAFTALEFLAKVLLWAGLVLLALDNLGFDITSLVAGLGVGGIAVALAVQNILGDVLCSVSIALDKPFEVGDFIIVGEQMGTVERVGIKTTRVRSLSGEQIIFPNADLVASRVRNYKRMQERRIVFKLGVTYQTPAQKIEKIPGMIRAVIESFDDLRFDRAHFASYGDSALVFEIVYYTLVPDYTLYMDRQQAINLALFKKFEDEGIEFAYPTQTLYVIRQEGGGPAVS